MMIKPKFLQPGDKIAVVAPAGKIVAEKLQQGIQLLESWNLEVVIAPHTLGNYNRFAGTDAQRLKDLQEALDHPHIKAVICARGGYGVSRIIDGIDWTKFKEKPKWIVGFSDITALLGEVQQMGFSCIHGPMAALVGQSGGERAADHLKKLLEGEIQAIQVPAHPANRLGIANAPITGGNLSVFCHLIGTRSMPVTRGRILFIEEIDEYLYNIDRMFVQLKRAGILEDLAGLMIGQMTGIKDDQDSFGKQVHEIVTEHTKAYNYPIAFDMPVGHEAHNLAIPFGIQASLKIDQSGTGLTF